jgi:hypothetical protein
MYCWDWRRLGMGLGRKKETKEGGRLWMRLLHLEEVTVRRHWDRWVLKKGWWESGVVKLVWVSGAVLLLHVCLLLELSIWMAVILCGQEMEVWQVRVRLGLLMLMLMQVVMLMLMQVVMLMLQVVMQVVMLM